jgi:hypothetical protein
LCLRDQNNRTAPNDPQELGMLVKAVDRRTHSRLAVLLPCFIAPSTAASLSPPQRERCRFYADLNIEIARRDRRVLVDLPMRSADHGTMLMSVKAHCLLVMSQDGQVGGSSQKPSPTVDARSRNRNGGFWRKRSFLKTVATGRSPRCGHLGRLAILSAFRRPAREH